jgi:hypothetical protein
MKLIKYMLDEKECKGFKYVFTNFFSQFCKSPLLSQINLVRGDMNGTRIAWMLVFIKGSWIILWKQGNIKHLLIFEIFKLFFLHFINLLNEH